MDKIEEEENDPKKNLVLLIKAQEEIRGKRREEIQSKLQVY